jgi:hypothetical protein
MRLLMLGLIFLLLLTLGNAWLLRRDRTFVRAHGYAPVQLRQRTAQKIEWDAFVWREIGAVALTAVVFGGIASVTRRSYKSERLR